MPQTSHPKHATLLFAHGAGADSQSEFMQFMQQHISHQKITVKLFDFPYMQQRQLTGKKSPPNRMPILLEAFQEQINIALANNNHQLFIGGKSMGGRVASMIAAQNSANIQGLICMGYPFHPPGKPENLRTEHLAQIEIPSLIIQGTRDTFGKPEEVASYALNKQLHVEWLDDGDHSFKTLKRSSATTEQSWHNAAKIAQHYILQRVEA